MAGGWPHGLDVMESLWSVSEGRRESELREHLSSV